MKIISLVILLIAAVPAMVFAGHGTIRETDSQIVVEYEGDAKEVAAAKIIKDREDKLKEQNEKLAVQYVMPDMQDDKHKADEAARIQKMNDNDRKLKAEIRARYIEH